MGLRTGTQLGPYEPLSAIAAGGMGEVYRARDTRLDRTVAIKILRDHLSDRAGLRERFEREARTIASLNHPHICVLHDIGHQDRTDFLVMDYVEGETLAERLKKGPLLDQVLLVACFAKLKKSGGFLRLAGVGVTLSGILKMTHVDRVIRIYPTALAASEDSQLDSGV